MCGMTARKQGGLSELGYIESLQSSAAWIFQGDNAWLPAIPLSPHAHLVGGLTVGKPQQLPEPFRSICNGARGTGLVFISMGTTGQPSGSVRAHEALLPSNQRCHHKLANQGSLPINGAVSAWFIACLAML